MRLARSGWPVIGAGLGLVGGAYYYIWQPWFLKTMEPDKEEARKKKGKGMNAFFED